MGGRLRVLAKIVPASPTPILKETVLSTTSNRRASQLQANMGQGGRSRVFLWRTRAPATWPVGEDFKETKETVCRMANSLLEGNCHVKVLEAGCGSASHVRF